MLSSSQSRRAGTDGATQFVGFKNPTPERKMRSALAGRARPTKLRPDGNA